MAIVHNIATLHAPFWSGFSIHYMNYMKREKPLFETQDLRQRLSAFDSPLHFGMAVVFTLLNSSVFSFIFFA